MDTGSIIEVVAALALFGVGIWQYRRRAQDGSRYGSQGAVILFTVAAIMLIHGLGLLEYRPSPAELGR